MSRPSRLLTEEVVEKATAGLKQLGKTGALSIKLMAIISSKKNGITASCAAFGITKATLISWIKRLDSSLEQLTVQKGRGRKALLQESQEDQVHRWILEDPHMTIDKLRLKLLENFGIKMARTTAHRLMKRLQFSYITPRPRHYKQDPNILEDAKKNLAKIIKENPEKRVFFMDEARFGTHSKLGHGWFKTGKRSRIAVKLGFKNFYVYTAVEPATGETFTLLLPKVNADMMSLFLKQLAKFCGTADIMVIMDGAGWHRSKTLEIPPSIQPLFLPAYCPEMNPVERLWLQVKRATIRNRIYDSLADLEAVVGTFMASLSLSTVSKVCAVDWFN